MHGRIYEEMEISEISTEQALLQSQVSNIEYKSIWSTMFTFIFVLCSCSILVRLRLNSTSQIVIVALYARSSSPSKVLLAAKSACYVRF